MRAFDHSDIRGIWLTVQLPINLDDSIDFGRLEEAVRYLAKTPNQGMYTNGTAGEFYNQTEEEFVAISEMVARIGHEENFPFMLGGSHMSPWISLERVKIARQLEPAAIQVVLPDWYPPSDEDAIEFLKRVAEAADPVKLVLYNPGHAKVNLTAEQVGRYKEAVPALVGIKGGVWREILETAPNLAERLSLGVAGHFYASGIQKGGHCSYSNMACLNPHAAQRWHELTVSDMAGALELEQRVAGFMTTHIIPLITEEHYSDQAVDKLLGAIGGWSNVGVRIRWPYRSFSEELAFSLRAVAMEVIPEFFPEKPMF